MRQHPQKNHSTLRRMIMISIFAALSFILMMIFNIPIIPAAPYLKYEPSGGIVLICGLLFGPIAALECAGIKSVLYLLMTGDIFGTASDFIATAIFAVLTVYLINKKTNGKILGFIFCCILGSVVTTAVMIPLNYLILWLEFAMPAAAVTASLVYVIPYNILKTLCNGLIGFVLTVPFKKTISKLITNY